jgi:hypothetical protein
MLRREANPFQQCMCLSVRFNYLAEIQLRKASGGSLKKEKDKLLSLSTCGDKQAPWNCR